jgi:hypothetical protein
MSQFGGKDSKRHFTVVMGSKEHGLYVSSTPSSAAKKAVTKLCASNKGKKVEFSIREITQGSKKKTYGPYEGYIEKLKEPIELKGRVIRYKPVAKLSRKSSKKKGIIGGGPKFSGSEAGPAEAGPAPVNNSNNNNNHDLDKIEQVAYINLKTPDRIFDDTDDYDENIELLTQIDDDIFDIRINNDSRGNGYGGSEPFTSIIILLKNYSIVKNKKNFERHLNILIEVLRYFKKVADSGLYDTDFNLFEPHDSFSPAHNEFLMMLPQLIDPIGPTVFQNKRFRNVPAPDLPNNFPPGNAPPFNLTNSIRPPKYRNGFPPGNAPHWNNS